MQSTSRLLVVQLLHETIDPGFSSIDILLVPTTSELAILKVIERLRPSMSVELEGTPRFIIKGCSTTFAPLQKYIFYVSLSRKYFLMQ